MIKHSTASTRIQYSIAICNLIYLKRTNIIATPQPVFETEMDDYWTFLNSTGFFSIKMTSITNILRCHNLSRIYPSIVPTLGRSNTVHGNIRNVTSDSDVIPTQSEAGYCMDAVRKYDYENFLCTLLLPTKVRAAAFAIRAFNIEIAQVQDLVSNIEIGNMRMHFWKDALERIYKGQPPHQPVARELTKVLNRHKLSKQWLTRLISSREKHLSTPTFPSLTSVEEYAETSVSPVYYLILESAGECNNGDTVTRRDKMQWQNTRYRSRN